MDARAAAFMGRKGIANGELVARMRGRFDVLVTADRPLPDENPAELAGIGVVIVPTNRRLEVERLVPATRAAVLDVAAGQTVIITP